MAERCQHGYGGMAPGICIQCKQEKAKTDGSYPDFTAWEKDQDGELESLLKGLYSSPGQP